MVFNADHNYLVNWVSAGLEQKPAPTVAVQNRLWTPLQYVVLLLQMHGLSCMTYPAITHIGRRIIPPSPPSLLPASRRCGRSGACSVELSWCSESTAAPPPVDRGPWPFPPGGRTWGDSSPATPWDSNQNTRWDPQDPKTPRTPRHMNGVVGAEYHILRNNHLEWSGTSVLVSFLHYCAIKSCIVVDHLCFSNSNPALSIMIW